MAASSCTYSHGDPDATPQPCDISPQTVTYAGVISPIFDANCRQCHAANVASALGGGTVLGDYQSIKQYPATALLGTIQHAPGFSRMPKNQAKLSDCDIRRIEAWVAAGQPNN